MLRTLVSIAIVALIVFVVFVFWRPDPAPEFNVNDSKPVPTKRAAIPASVEVIE